MHTVNKGYLKKGIVFLSVVGLLFYSPLKIDICLLSRKYFLTSNKLSDRYTSSLSPLLSFLNNKEYYQIKPNQLLAKSIHDS